MDRSKKERCTRGILLLLPLAFFASGLWGLWPYLRAEHARLAPWEVPLIWMGEFVALLCYLAFAWSSLRSADATDERGREVRWDRDYMSFFAILLIGIGIDGALSIRSAVQEHSGLKRAVPVVGQIIRGDPIRHLSGNVSFVLYCRFHDANGNVYNVRFKPEPDDLSERSKDAIVKGKLPVDINLEYDPQRPSRCWLQGASDPTHNRLYGFSGNVILWQFILGNLFYVLRRESPRAGWVPPIKAAPFLAASIVLGLVGTLSLVAPLV